MITIPAHLNGPVGAANGGAAAGFLADLLDEPVAIRFHAPVPLGTPLQPQRADDGTVRVEADGVHVVTVRPWNGEVDIGHLTIPEPDDVSRAEAQWSVDYGRQHPYPTCFGCGPARATDDGLGLRPGFVPSDGVHATAWTPPGTGTVPAWLVWAALDCASGGPALHGTTPDQAVVTGQLAVAIDRPVPAGTDLVAVTRAQQRDGAKTVVTGMLVDRTTRTPLATTTSTWFTIPRSAAP
jgi:hypothetical protein